MNLFKQEGKKPFSYPSIEVRKSSRKSTWLLLGFVLLLVTIGIFFSD